MEGRIVDILWKLCAPEKTQTVSIAIVVVNVVVVVVVVVDVVVVVVNVVVVVDDVIVFVVADFVVIVFVFWRSLDCTQIYRLLG